VLLVVQLRADFGGDIFPVRRLGVLGLLRSERQTVVADQHHISFAELRPLFDLLAVLFDAVPSFDVLDVQLPVMAHEPRVAARDIALGETNRIPFFTPDCNLIADDRDDIPVSLVILD